MEDSMDYIIDRRFLSIKKCKGKGDSPRDLWYTPYEPGDFLFGIKLQVEINVELRLYIEFVLPKTKSSLDL